MAFTADHRNFGGRDQIIGQIKNHHINMQKVVPTMNTRIKPKKHIDYFKTYSKKSISKKNFSVQLQSKPNC